MKALLKGLKEPKSTEEAAEQYAEVAKKAGYDLKKEAILNVLKAKEKVQKAITEKAENTVKVAINEKELETVAGGGEIEGGTCESTFDYGEWCWVSDSCAVVINSYTGEKGVDPMICVNNTTNLHLPELEGPGDWESWRDFCPGTMLGEDPAPLPDPWEDL